MCKNINPFSQYASIKNFGTHQSVPEQGGPIVGTRIMCIAIEQGIFASS